MKHYSPRRAMIGADQLQAALRDLLDGSTGAKAALAQRLGISNRRLSLIVRGQHPVPDDVAVRMGFRRVTMFEPID